jgi:hypothetical protein
MESGSESRVEQVMNARRQNGTGSTPVSPTRRIRPCHAGWQAATGLAALNAVSAVTVW